MVPTDRAPSTSRSARPPPRSARAVLASVLRLVLILLASAGWVLRAFAAEPEAGDHAHHHHDATQAPDPHAHHHEMMGAMKRAQRSLVDVTVPDVKLVRQDGKTVTFPAELDDGRPVVLDFIFTTCTTICPVTSRIFSQLQAKVGSEPVHLVSISIDPEQDTPARLVEYARKFGAGPQWQHYTGTVQASVAVQRAFNAYRGDKMNHTPVTFLRAGPGRRWVRIDGFASADELAAELRELVATR